MRVLILTVLLVLMVSAVYAGEPERVISVQHDSIRGATCWVLNDQAISCVPDSQLRQPAEPPKRSVGSAKPTSTFTPRRDEEVFQL
jgi:hypothetical protein